MAIEHKDIPESGLHEPKGVSSAAANQVYVSDGTGSGNWIVIPRIALRGLTTTAGDSGKIIVTDAEGGFTVEEAVSYGAMTITNNTVAFPATAVTDTTFNTPSEYQLLTGAGAPWNSENLSGITFSTDSLTVPANGVYKFDFWSQIDSFPSTTSAVALRYNVNGTTFSTRFPIAKSNANGDTKEWSFSELVSLNAGDVVQLYIGSDTTGNLVIRHLSFSIALARGL